MPSKAGSMGQEGLKEQVLDRGLCTNCGACVNLCPYFVSHRDKMIIMDHCDRTEGRCYAFCPRTLTDLDGLRRELFDPSDLTPELGPMKGFYITRAVDEEVRSAAQHGGTVTTLMALALKEGLIDAAVLAEDPGELLPQGVVVTDPAELVRHAGSKFVVSPTVAAFNQAAKGSAEKIGVVATPCQATALAKMRAKPFPENESNIHKLQLVIGLFCGWALSWRSLKEVLQDRVRIEDLVAMDIPPSMYHSMEAHTRGGVMEISLDEVLPCVREACGFCLDMTAEFSDVSVGSARLPEGWEVARSWNQVIVRSGIGRDLVELARGRGLLEFREVPEGNLEKLKKASMNKKRFALMNLIRRSGNPDDLLYLDPRDAVIRNLSA
jgi:coenzyme F420 hydrogenase subunit beta